MKKRIIAFIICIALLCPLCSCSDKAKLLRLKGDERADAFFDIVNEDPADSYACELKMEITGSLYGVELEAEIESDTTYIGYNGNTPILHTESRSEISVGPDLSETVQITKSVNGYRDGKLYEMTERDGVKTALVSSITADDYKAHKESLVSYSDEALSAIHKSATVKECLRNDDGTWSASYSGYPEESVRALIDYAFDPTVLILDGWGVKDIVFTVEADAELLPTEWEYEIVFEKTKGDLPKPEARSEIEFHDVGTAEAPEIDLSSCTEVEGLAQLQQIRKILSDKLLVDHDSFTAISDQKVEYNSTTQHTEETDIVTVKTENGNYTFDIESEIFMPGIVGATNAKITYKNGRFNMSGNNISTQNYEMSDSEARAYISRLYDPAGLSSAQISDISKNTSGLTYVFTLADPDHSAFEASLASMGAGNIQATASVGVDYENGVLKAYDYTMIITANVSGRKLTIEIKSGVIFTNGMNNEV